MSLTVALWAASCCSLFSNLSIDLAGKHAKRREGQGEPLLRLKDSPAMDAKTAAANKRLALSRDQRAVLEAVYAVEKLPDAPLRDRLSKYLDLSTRQIQVCAHANGRHCV